MFFKTAFITLLLSQFLSTVLAATSTFYITWSSPDGTHPSYKPGDTITAKWQVNYDANGSITADVDSKVDIVLMDNSQGADKATQVSDTLATASFGDQTVQVPLPQRVTGEAYSLAMVYNGQKFYSTNQFTVSDSSSSSNSNSGSSSGTNSGTSGSNTADQNSGAFSNIPGSLTGLAAAIGAAFFAF